ncbi:MAG: protein tyrosine phosphatase family protein [Planctomycetota bacterium]
MRNTTPLPLLLVLLMMLGCQTGPTETVEPTSCGDVKNMHRVGDLYLAGAPTASDYPLLKDLGIKTVLSIRHDKETPSLDDAALVEAQGMTYMHLPWSGADQLTDETLDAMRKVLRNAERPMLFHCGSANRVGAGWLAYRVLDEGVALDTALAEAKTFGLRTKAYETITVAYIARRPGK